MQFVPAPPLAPAPPPPPPRRFRAPALRVQTPPRPPTPPTPPWPGILPRAYVSLPLVALVAVLNVTVILMLELRAPLDEPLHDQSPGWTLPLLALIICIPMSFWIFAHALVPVAEWKRRGLRLPPAPLVKEEVPSVLAEADALRREINRLDALVARSASKELMEKRAKLAREERRLRGQAEFPRFLFPFLEQGIGLRKIVGFVVFWGLVAAAVAFPTVWLVNMVGEFDKAAQWDDENRTWGETERQYTTYSRTVELLGYLTGTLGFMTLTLAGAYVTKVDEHFNRMGYAHKIFPGRGSVFALGCHPSFYDPTPLVNGGRPVALSRLWARFQPIPEPTGPPGSYPSSTMRAWFTGVTGTSAAEGVVAGAVAPAADDALPLLPLLALRT